MHKELFITSTPHETRLAITEDGEVAEVYVEREHEHSLAGSIYKGRVTRVLPGMQSAFVDIGLERDAFLDVSDFFEDSEEYDRVVSDAEDAVAKLDPHRAEGTPSPAPRPLEEAGSPASELAQTPQPAPSGAAGGPRPASSEGRAERGGEERSGGRRHRRGRGRNRGGFPESKFARPEDLQHGGERGSRPAPPVVPRHEPEPDDNASDATLPDVIPPFAAVPDTPPPAVTPAVAPPYMTPEYPAFVLPGESLAKYRNASPPPVSPAPVAAPEAPAAPTHELKPTEETLPPPEALASPAAVPEDEPDFTATQPDEREPLKAAPAPESDVEEIESAPIRDEAEELEFTDLAEVDYLSEEEEERLAEASMAAEGAPLGEAEGTAPASSDLSAAMRHSSGQVHMQGRRRRRRRRRPQDGSSGPASQGPSASAETAGPATSTTMASDAVGLVNGQANGKPRQEARPETRSESGGRDRDRPPQTRLIGDLLHEGQEILIQISKEPLGRKGARITSHLALPGRFLVYMPTVGHIGVSRKIGSDEERARLKRLILDNTRDLPGGFIVRTAGASASDEDFKADIRFLSSLWSDLRQQFEASKGPRMLHHDLNLVERTLRDQFSDQFTHVWVDNDEEYQSAVRFVNYFKPHLTSRIRLYTREIPLFEHFGIQDEINKALKSKVWLKSGGYIVINQTEALVAIDVNTGKYVGKSNRLEDTIVKVNVDAIKEIVRQIRLRDLGGIIVVDFIDMDERRNRQKVMQAFEEAMRSDRAPSKLLAFNDFGLVAMTRKRVKQSLERTLGSPCNYCQGVGLVKSVTTMCNEIYSEAKKLAKTIERDDMVLRVNPDVARGLKARGATYIEEIEQMTGKTLLIKPDPQVHQEQFEFS